MAKKFYARQHPQAATRLCRYPGCRVVTAEGYCKTHREHSPKNQRSDWYWEVAKPFYDSPEWRSCRAAKLAETPWCEHCREDGRWHAANEVDHIIPLADCWERRLDPTNLQCLCESHHSRKTIGEMRARRANRNA